MDLRPLGDTGIQVSPFGLGTVKFGRNTQVKYPRPFDLPSDAEISNLLALARELGINLLDTAPAYGSSQERIGQLLPGPRAEWVIVSKVGEFYDDDHGSRFDFSYETTITVVEQSLRTLKTDYLDCILIHSDGDDLRILQQEGAKDALQHLKERGLIRAHGMSSKTVEGGLATLAEMDVAMVTCNPSYNEELAVLETAARDNKGILIKKGLSSGHLSGPDAVEEAMGFIFAQPGVSSMISGTLNPDHLRANIQALNRVLGT